jgi:pimeloyl-ACP methyl ester carboxylesterase
MAVPTLLVVGNRDQCCTAPVCTSGSILQHERPHYSPEAVLDAVVVADSDHSVQLHENAPQTNAAILDWLSVAAPSNR